MGIIWNVEHQCFVVSGEDSRVEAIIWAPDDKLPGTMLDAMARLYPGAHLVAEPHANAARLREVAEEYEVVLLQKHVRKHLLRHVLNAVTGPVPLAMPDLHRASEIVIHTGDPG